KQRRKKQRRKRGIKAQRSITASKSFVAITQLQPGRRIYFPPGFFCSQPSWLTGQPSFRTCLAPILTVFEHAVGQFSPARSVLQCGGTPPLFTCMRIDPTALRTFRQFFHKAFKHLPFLCYLL